jgi:hypothetical protein
VVRVLINDDLVAIPEPVTGVVVIGWGNTKEEATETETLPVPSPKMVDMTRPKAAREASMFERTIDVISGVTAARIMTHPLIIVCMHVRSLRVPSSIRMSGILRRSRALIVLSSGRSGTVSGNVSAPNTMTATAMLSLILFLLRKTRERKHGQQRKNSEKVSHIRQLITCFCVPCRMPDCNRTNQSTR